MRYLPKSPTERHEMLSAIGAQSIDELFSSIPEQFRLREALKLPGPFSEAEVIQYFKARATENSFGYTSFLVLAFTTTCAQWSPMPLSSAASFSPLTRLIRRRSHKAHCRRSSSFRRSCASSRDSRSPTLPCGMARLPPLRLC